ncbi:MAG: Ftsk gamma domain [Massilia sp.]|nr:Ftsk gamma domain [Massilia sp.]
MTMQRNEWPCGCVTETAGYAPAYCPFHKPVAALPAAPAPTERPLPEAMPSPIYFKALALAHESGRASVSQTQRILRIGWSDAENLIDLMIQRGDVEFAMTSGLRPARQAPDGVDARDAKRYRFVRTLSPRQFAEIHTRNISGAGCFDDLIDAAQETPHAQ